MSLLNQDLMLQFLDILLTITHLLIIGFNLFGWAWPKTRKLHLFFIILTACSWFVLGIWFGMGYCPITDWQWDVKKELGEIGLPNSFVEYYAEKITGRDFSASFINIITVSAFAVAAFLSIYFNFLVRKKR